MFRKQLDEVDLANAANSRKSAPHALCCSPHVPARVFQPIWVRRQLLKDLTLRRELSDGLPRWGTAAALVRG